MIKKFIVMMMQRKNKEPLLASPTDDEMAHKINEIIEEVNEQSKMIGVLQEEVQKNAAAKPSACTIRPHSYAAALARYGDILGAGSFGPVFVDRCSEILPGGRKPGKSQNGGASHLKPTSVCCGGGLLDGIKGPVCNKCLQYCKVFLPKRGQWSIGKLWFDEVNANKTAATRSSGCTCGMYHEPGCPFWTEEHTSCNSFYKEDKVDNHGIDSVRYYGEWLENNKIHLDAHTRYIMYAGGRGSYRKAHNTTYWAWVQKLDRAINNWKSWRENMSLGTDKSFSNWCEQFENELWHFVFGAYPDVFEKRIAKIKELELELELEDGMETIKNVFTCKPKLEVGDVFTHKDGVCLYRVDYVDYLRKCYWIDKEKHHKFLFEQDDDLFIIHRRINYE